MSHFYTSRSAIETYQTCPRKRWLGYIYNGRGLAQKQLYVPYTTGTCVHKGIEFLLRNYQNGIITEAKGPEVENWIDEAVGLSLQEYTKLVTNSGVQVRPGEQEAFILKQEAAKTEALVRAWAISEFPYIVSDYKIYSVEDEVVVPISNEIMFQAKVDAILQEKVSGGFYNYSLKTMASYYEGKTDRTFKYSLQHITEMWAAEQYLKQIRSAVDTIKLIGQKRITDYKKSLNFRSFLDKYIGSNNQTSIMGTKFCFLVKGGKAKEVPTVGEEDDYIASSPLIKGYALNDEGARMYAHSFKFPEPRNKSGFGRLGKGWEPFNVWEEMTVKEWFSIITSKVTDHTGEEIFEVQPECGDILKKQVVTIPEVFAKRDRIESKLIQIKIQEQNVRMCLMELQDSEEMTKTSSPMLDMMFQQNEKSCWFPTPCEFTPICHLVDYKGDSINDKVRKDPIGCGLYVYRVPHHRAELEQLMVDQAVTD